MAAAAPVSHGSARLDGLSAEDFETASIRSAAPSYISEAPSYHSTYPNNSESVPAYTPRTTSGINSSAEASSSRGRTESQTESRTETGAGRSGPGYGLPRIPSPNRQRGVPNLNEFRIPTWSNMNSNPTARHYHSVAQRRVVAANSMASSSALEGALRDAFGRLNAEEENKIRPLEDPYLVGEEAAARAKRERLARENGDAILYREDRRWDWFLAQMKDTEEREASWNTFRRNLDSRHRGTLARRLNGRFLL